MKMNVKFFCLLPSVFLGLFYSNLYANNSISPHIMQLAHNAYAWAQTHDPQEIKNKQALTIIDFTKSSKDYRMWVVNPRTDQILMSLRVAQGRNSGLDYATRFSNEPRSQETSLGVYATANYTQYGHDGFELPLYGLEKGINSNAYSRAIIVHGAWYVTPEFIREHNRAGRSWGCFAVDPSQLRQFIALVKGGSVIFAYAAAENRDRNLNA